jgi:sensor histidine kinase regulating citrate/malate metabolism
MAPDRTRYTHPTPTEIGQPFIGSVDDALAGHTIVETYTGTRGESVRTVVPVTAADSGGADICVRLPVVP